MAKPGPAKVAVTLRKGTVTVVPPEVVINWKDPTLPDEVEWEVDSDDASLAVKILWSIAGAPFGAVEETAARKAGKKKLGGKWNRRQSGRYAYSVVFYDPTTGQIKAGLDPRIINEPIPP